MPDDRMALTELLLQKSGENDFQRAVVEAVLQILMEADVEGLIGAARHERSADRLNYRNGSRDRSLETRLGTLSCGSPSSYSHPSWSRKTAEKALVTVIHEARIGGGRPAASTNWCRRWACRASQRAKSRNCTRTSTSEQTPSSTARSTANGPICGLTRLTSRSATAVVSSRLPQ